MPFTVPQRGRQYYHSNVPYRFDECLLRRLFPAALLRYAAPAAPGRGHELCSGATAITGDIANTKLVVMFGTNPAESHGERRRRDILCRTGERPNARMIAASTRVITTTPPAARRGCLSTNAPHRLLPKILLMSVSG